MVCFGRNIFLSDIWYFQEERKNILDEWGDDEEDESEEKKKINETLGRSSEDGSDDEGSVHGEGTI